MDIVSLFLSIIAVSVTVYNCYRQYFKKTEGIALTISGALIENNELKVLSSLYKHRKSNCYYHQCIYFIRYK